MERLSWSFSWNELLPKVFLTRYITKLPWCIKPVFAYISDRYYISGYRTKIYFLITGFSEMLCLLLLGIQIKSTFVVTFLILLDQISLAFRDSLAEALMVILTKTEERNQQREIQRQREQWEEEQRNLLPNEGDGNKSFQAKDIVNNSQKYVTAIFIVRFVGSFFTSYISGILLLYMTPHQLLLACSVLPFITIIHALFFFKEPKQKLSIQEKKNLENFSIADVWKSVEEYKWQGYLFFIVVLLSWPNTINGIRYFLIDHLHMSTYDIGLIFTIGSLFYIGYMNAMNIWFSDYTLRGYYKLIHLLMVLDIIFRYSQMLPAFYPEGMIIAVGDQIINNLFYDLPSIPLLAIVSSICPIGKEATYYAFFVSISNFFCSFANFTGYLYLRILNVTSEDYT